MEKNYTDILLGYREHRDDITEEDYDIEADSQSLLSHSVKSNSATELYTIPISVPKWMPYIEAIRSIINDIDHKLFQLTEAYDKHLLITFDDETNTVSTINNLTKQITQLFRSANDNLKKLVSNKPVSEMGHEDHLKDNAKKQLAGQLLDLSKQFRKYQQVYMNRLRERDEKSKNFNIIVTNYTTNNETLIEDYIDYNPSGNVQQMLTEDRSSNQQMLTEDRSSDQQMVIIDKYIWQAKEQGKEIRQIAQSINELADIINDIQLLVSDQGEIIDRIDYNIEKADARVETGLEEIIESKEIMVDGCCANLTKYIIISLVVIILMEVFMIILKHTLFN